MPPSDSHGKNKDQKQQNHQQIQLQTFIPKQCQNQTDKCLIFKLLITEWFDYNVITDVLFIKQSWFGKRRKYSSQPVSGRGKEGILLKGGCTQKRK